MGIVVFEFEKNGKLNSRLLNPVFLGIEYNPLIFLLFSDNQLNSLIILLFSGNQFNPLIILLCSDNQFNPLILSPSYYYFPIKKVENSNGTG